MRAGCSASTFILVASWGNPCTQGVLGIDSHTGNGPLKTLKMRFAQPVF